MKEMKKNEVTLKVRGDYIEDFDTCEECKHCGDSEEVCRARQCVHAFGALKECFEKKDN